ncbi:MAG: hypothetical protein B7C24_00870 [Bacteroidetes bacterium 4572_77]|nr:MAG: hypothetical protein B7C24_00870 [Bacteroidetes bacterium 4572_77]
MNEKVKIELSNEQFTALTHCMLSYEAQQEEDFDKVLMARHILGKVLKKMINRYQNIKKKNKISLNLAEAAAFRTLMISQVDRCGIYEQTIIRDILMQIGSKI